MIPVGGKYTATMSARQLDAELHAEDEANRSAGLRWHVGRTLWDLSELRECAPDCQQHPA